MSNIQKFISASPPKGVYKVEQYGDYNISDIDDSEDPKYYGFLDKDGNWYIMKETSGAYRYTKGNSNYATNWANRASLSYDYFNNVF